MNANTHISGQMSSQASTQMSGLPQQISNSVTSQMQNLDPRTMDPELIQVRRTMRQKIYNILQRRNHSGSSDWLHKIQEIVMRLEQRMFRDGVTRDEYLNLVSEPDENRFFSVIKNIISNRQHTSHQIRSSSTLGTMIPTPGIPHSGSTHSIISHLVENPTASGSSMGCLAATNMRSLQPTANGQADVNASFNAADVCNGYQQQATNFSLGSGGSIMMPSISSASIPGQSSQMIPTPGFINPHSVSVNTESSNATAFSSCESTIPSQTQQPKKFVGNQNSHVAHSFRGQIDAGFRSNIQQKAASHGLSNGIMNGGLGSIGSNMQLNRLAVSEGLLKTVPCSGLSKPTQQANQPRMPMSSSEQVLPVGGGGYAMKAVDVSGSDIFCGPSASVLSAMNNLNAGNSHSNLRTNSSLQYAQIRSHTIDSSLASQLTNEHLPQSQPPVQQSQQQPNQPYSQFIQNQCPLQHQQQHQQNQLMLKHDSLRQTSVNSFDEQLMAGPALVTQSESQASQRIQLPELQSQCHEGQAKIAQFLNHLSGSQALHVPVSQGSHQVMHPNQLANEFANEVNYLFSGSQGEEHLRVQHQIQPLQKAQMTDKLSNEEQPLELCQKTIGQDEVQQSHVSLERCITGSFAIAPQFSRGLTCGPEQPINKQNYVRQIRWLLFLHHARWCPAPKGQCQEINCTIVQELVIHMRSCNSEPCGYARCSASKGLLRHFRNCRAVDCPVCVSVRNYMAASRKSAHALSNAGSGSQTEANTSKSKTDIVLVETSNKQSVPKRMKIEHLPLLVPKNETSPVSLISRDQPYDSHEAQLQNCKQTDMNMSAKCETVDAKDDQCVISGQENLPIVGTGFSGNVNTKIDMDYGASDCIDCHVKQENMKQENMMAKEEMDQVRIEIKHGKSDQPTDQATGSKSGKPKIKGVSLMELFTPEQIREHIVSLRQWVGQSKAKAEKNQAREHSMSENSCQLCAVEKLTFDPPPIYCSICGARIKRNATYYTLGSGETRHYFCVPCYNEARGETIEVEGSTFQKTKLEKKKNDEETEEWWVQCDKCEVWQHQICALFNGRRNEGGQAEYTCPNCCVKEIDRGEWKPLPQSAVLGAKDMPRTILSDHIEQRLFKRLKLERMERARQLGKNLEEVPGAEGLVVRVVSSVDKKLEVKQRFLEIFQEENYPKEFPYKSKAVLLFQKIEGVEVCLFGMYVQEFGSECSFPNQRRVYLSYLDSVKYFRPDTRSVTGEALRTFVYHEILIGYLEYCKKRGFTSCYIWACPPLKGEDYILYCHPEIQKTPKSDKLREWYLSMIRKAAKENIVVEVTNFYDHFFVNTGECKAKITAARLPYFDGDYWPGAAEDMINQLRLEEDDRKQQKKGKTKKTITKRALKAAGHADLSGNASKDALLMHKLGETICPMKEDFIMVHLQYACTHCCILMVSGTRWVCNQCKNFQICDKCHEAEQRLEERERHPVTGREKHVLCAIEINDVVLDTKDEDEILESEFFDTRQAFLSLCQGNHYQYDTLRRAKHSSMMVLYHLHNPTAPAFVTTCNICQHDIETGQGWRCESCPDFDVCNACYQKEGGIDHPHKLTNHPSLADRDAQNKEARQKRVLQLRKMLDLLVHASQCRYPHCQYPNCRKVKGLFRHGIQCRIRASGGCVLCKKMWYLLQIHARACKESECNVPRCRDLREHLRRLQQQSESRRRAAVMEMMRQRAAEVAGSSG
uniref:histone acetyltransferase n=1 Tax=Musa acuminata subsp. malaccensis TaxID=214687 RepID=A0A804J100_MUSAM|nr:PREDICTED: probable histone acetyltransferase HAC-like 1 isoform X1 [Musa acuminata subsp. malaccensis]XP_009399628.1 PREDICTED: probable histone acetyltransferase HAC-like 1 isoform X1 [Musa acuminata subsp. malaccensis]XP_009399629.1 PREDICTED: probable histone acetyltransferase HAC-like 1 isoform X1 [Musa acuminata subsp. malaccensis]XP_009399630.1 PREDICTED: probable histone acetyltransferase HAC-like 1 isoform X1 [Musa acuminata subsp. malaccensis]XP_018681904.1 PREDICTED: probable hist